MNPLISTFIAIFTAIFMTIIGRLLSTHTGERYYHTTPLHCFIAGLGIWYLWFLLFTRLGDISIDIIVYLFAGCSIALFFALPKVFHIKQEMEHFWSLMVMTIIILLPVFFSIGMDEPTFWREFTTDIRNADYLFWLNSLPSVSEVQSHNIIGMDNPIALPIAVTPVAYISQSFSPAVFACWSLFLLVVTMGGLARSADIEVKWSNLPLVAAGGLIAIVIFNPFLQAEAIFSSYQELWIAATFFCAMMPLFSKKQLPHGWEVIPTAFVLVFLTGLAPEGIYLVAIVMTLWFVRMLIEQNSNFIEIVFALVVLLTLSLSTFWLWYGGASFVLAVDTSLPEVITSQFQYYMAITAGSIIGIITVWHFTKIIVCGKCSRRELIIENAWYILPAIIFIIGVITSFIFGGHWGLKYLLYSQFILLLPVWVWLRYMYDDMWVHKLAFRSPWAVGFFLILIVVGTEFSYKNAVNINKSATLEHIKQVGTHVISQHKKSFGSRIVVLDGYDANFHAGVMGYELRHHSQVTSMDDILNLDKNMLHSALSKNKVDYIWLHRVSEPLEQLLSVRLERGYSYLFAVEDFDFRLLTIYPHPKYK